MRRTRRRAAALQIAVAAAQQEERPLPHVLLSGPPGIGKTTLACIGLEGLSHVEAAAVLGIGADACRKRWQRLRERLQDDVVLVGSLAPA